MISLPTKDALYPNKDTFLIFYDSDLSPLDLDPTLTHKDYFVTVTASLGKGLGVTIASEVFTLRLLNPCHDPSLTSITPPVSLSTLPWEYTLLEGPREDFLTEEFTISTPFADSTSCGDLSYQV